MIRGLKSYKFKVKVNPEYAWDLKEMWTEYVDEKEIKLSGSTPYFIVERSPEAQKIFNKMGASFSKLQKKIKNPKVIRANWRDKEFYVKANADEDEKLLVTILEDLTVEWNAEGVEVTGFTEIELIAAMA